MWTFETFTAGAKTIAVWSEVSYQDFVNSKRLDAEYFRPEFIAYERLTKISGHSIRNYIKAIIQPTEFIREYVSKAEGAKFWRAQNIKRGYIDEGNIEYIDWDTFELSSKSQVNEGDILITRTGANAGDCAVVPAETSEVIVSSHTLRLIPKTVEMGYVIGTFLSTDLGRGILLRTISGSSRPQITKEMLFHLSFPDFGSVAGEITSSILQVNRLHKHSQSLYSEAEDLLLHELGLNTLDLTHQPAYEATFEDTIAAGRMDAEYFQPKYQNALAVMGRSGKRISDFVHLAQRRFKPETGKSFKYIEIGSLSGNGQADSELILGDDAPSRAQWVVKTNDIITSTVRPIRRLTGLIEPSQDKSVCSSGFAVFEPKNIEPEVLLVYLRLPIVCEILDLHTTASMYPAISVEDLLNTPITLPSDAVCTIIVDKVHVAREIQLQAARLLAEAKQRVENLILAQS